MTSLLTHPLEHTALERSVDRSLSLDELAAVARGLAETAHSWPGVTDPTERIWHTIAEADCFEAFVIAWPAGASIDLHDHGDAAGAIAVARGGLVERVSQLHSGAPELVTHRLSTGVQLAFRSGHVHELSNPGPGPALSVHVYSPVLRSMTFFERAPGGTPLPVRTERYGESAR
jgi:predicted metal-dependent enzyme (double-stranded beta helix superfamily)